MHISKLRLLGFKSFVEPTDLIIQHGLTGVVGPNGCGKSNLLEALRWVMGESSYKSMRASAMEDVIFSGTVTRPARNAAEVTIFLDNSTRTAPVEFNDNDDIEITRRIERDAGSSYRINGREARARDVKILFEDAATGARSPALVRQGQIGEIVNSKPEQRRRILEDAAGIAGLHSRRHEAELRLKAAENNLARIGDILGQFKSQLDGLKRQARQARRYADLSGQIREIEAVALHLTWAAAQGEVAAEEAALQAALQALGVATQAEAAALRREAELSESVQPLREQAMVRAAVVTRQRHELEKLKSEGDRISARQGELSQQAERLARDRVRETELIEESKRQQVRLEEEHVALTAEQGQDKEREAELSGALESANAELSDAEIANTQAQSALNERLSEARSLLALTSERTNRRARLETQLELSTHQMAELVSTRPAQDALVTFEAECGQLAKAIAKHEAELDALETARTQADDALQVARTDRETATIALKELEAEQATLKAVLQTGEQSFPPILDQVSVDAGFEAALGAALGDDIEASVDAAAPAYWDDRFAASGDTHGEDQALPVGVSCLSDHVDSPIVLRRRLRQIGIVDSEDGARLQLQLAPGQRLVSRAGDLWRWDGLVIRGDAPSAAAQRLAGRNRLKAIAGELADQGEMVASANQAMQAASMSVQQTQSDEKALRQRLGDDQATLAIKRNEAARHVQAIEAFDVKVTGLRTAIDQAQAEFDELGTALAESEAALTALPAVAGLESNAQRFAEQVVAARTRVSELKAERAGLARQRERIAARLESIGRERVAWGDRAKQSEARLESITNDLSKVASDQAALIARPAEIAALVEELRAGTAISEKEQVVANDAVSEAETALRDAAGTLRDVASEVAERREARARTEARLEGARLKRAGIVQKIHDTFETTPEGCLAIAQLEPEVELPSLGEAEGRLARLRTERERLGGVNLQAERELSELEEQFDVLDVERADVEEAIAKLRGGIASLNREGRKRLREAFTTVDEHFQALFQTLFDGGEARLSMIESDDDPLAGGLEIIAKPPGKKPTTLSLLSGGEQTLTALSLIFAVFLTNPSPICVLDEVDAPLDDANVDRFCRMMEKMAADTDTRFLCITHHPETMARMDRLFGVTMGEKGVSQLVSVDLQAAERFLEAS